MRKPTTRTIKVMRAFCTWHPDFWQDENGDYGTLPTGHWVVEWTIQELHNLIWEHYTASFSKKEEAYKLLKKIEQNSGEFDPWGRVSLDDDIFTAGKLTALVSRGKREVNRV